MLGLFIFWIAFQLIVIWVVSAYLEYEIAKRTYEDEGTEYVDNLLAYFILGAIFPLINFIPEDSILIERRKKQKISS